LQGFIKKILVTDPNKRCGFEDIKHHSWFMSVNNVLGKNIFFNSTGVFIGEDVLPIDVEIVAEIYNDFYIDIIKIVNDVLRNIHNKITTTYYLILKRKIRNNENIYTEMNDSLVSNNNKNAKIKINNIPISDSKKEFLNNPVQNGGIDIRISKFYDEGNTVSTNPYVGNKNDKEEPSVQKIKESYKPKIIIQEFLQTDSNNIKMNERLFKYEVELNNEINFNKLNNNNNINVLKSEESANKDDYKKIINQKKLLCQLLKEFF